MNSNKGFTLIELLITITIMAILTGIAWSLFSQQKAKAWRQDCLGGISGTAQALEVWRNTNGTYSIAGINAYKPAVSNTNLQTCQQRGYQTSANAAGPFASCHNACQLTVTIPDTRANAPADSYLITATRVYNAATPVSDKDSDCNIFALNDLGQKSATNLAGTSSGFTPGTAALRQIKAKCWLEN